MREQCIVYLGPWARHMSIMDDSLTPIGQRLGGMAAIHRLTTGNVIKQPLELTSGPGGSIHSNSACLMKLKLTGLIQVRSAGEDAWLGREAPFDPKLDEEEESEALYAPKGVSTSLQSSSHPGNSLQQDKALVKSELTDFWFCRARTAISRSSKIMSTANACCFGVKERRAEYQLPCLF